MAPVLTMAYHDALYKFVVGATPETIAAIKTMADQQEKIENNWFEARSKVPESALPEFDAKVFAELSRMCKQFSRDLGRLGVPLDTMDPRGRQKMLAVLGDLTRHQAS